MVNDICHSYFKNEIFTSLLIIDDFHTFKKCNRKTGVI